MEIKWFNKYNSSLVTTITKNNITLNKACTEFVDDKTYFMLGFNCQNKCVFIKPISFNLVENGEVENASKSNSRNGCIRISNTSFLNEVSKQCNVQFSKENKKYDTKWDTDNDYFIVYLNSEVNK